MFFMGRTKFFIVNRKEEITDNVFLITDYEEEKIKETLEKGGIIWTEGKEIKWSGPKPDKVYEWDEATKQWVVNETLYKKALEDLKTRNLDKLIIYSNSDFGQNNSNKENPSDMRPKSQKEIEKKAFDLNIEIDWRLGSRFESEFVCIENSTIASHFFSNDHSIISLISDIIEEKNIFLDNSKSPITFNNFEKEPNILKSSEKKTILISGISGVGKTTLVKNYFSSIKKESENNDFGLYILKPDRFDVKTISDVFSIKVDDFIDFHKDSNHKIIVIDSAEKLITIEDLTIFKLFYKKLSNSDWKFIFTVIEQQDSLIRQDGRRTTFS